MIYVMVGGAVGAIIRWWLSNLLPSRIGTIFVNIVGSFIGGFLIQTSFTEPLQLLLLSGFLGSFTTFSTLQVEGVQWIEDGKLAKGIMYTCIILIVSIGMAAVGFMIAGLLVE